MKNGDLLPTLFAITLGIGLGNIAVHAFNNTEFDKKKCKSIGMVLVEDVCVKGVYVEDVES